MDGKNMAIFDSICELVTKPEFTEDQMAFYQQKCHIFIEEEENKLEYTQVYEQFVEIMERTIEAKLTTEYNYSDEEIKEFLNTFVESIDSYREKNPETVDILYGFVDFAKFKTSMLTYKKGMIDKKGDASELNKEMQLQTTSGDDEDAFKIFMDLFNEPLTNWTKKVHQKDLNK